MLKAIKIPTWKEMRDARPMLELLDRCGEEGVWAIWAMNDEGEIEFKDGKAVIEYHYNASLAEKMIFKRRTSPDICYFWNSIDPINRRILMGVIGLIGVIDDLEFFVWLGNNHCEWRDGFPLKTTIVTYFEASEEVQKKWLNDFRTSMSKYY